MISFDNVTKENIKEHTPNWPQTPDYSYRILIIGGSGACRTSWLFNFISQQPDVNKIKIHMKKNIRFLINKRESAELKHLSDSTVIIEYSNDMDNIYKNIEKYNPNKKKHEILIFLDDMISDMLSKRT